MRWTKRMASVLKLLLDVVLCRGDIAEVVAQSQPIPFVSLFRYGQRSDVIRVVAGCGCALLGGLIQPLVLIIGSTIVTLFLNPESKFHNESFWDSIKHRLIIYAAVGFVAFFFSFWQTYLLRNASGNICRRIKQEFLAAILCHDASFFDVTNSGAITSQLNNNVEQIQDGIGDKIGMILRGFSMFISSIIYCLFLDWRLTLIAMTMGPLSAIILGLQGKLVSSTVNESMEISSMAAETLEESVMNVKTVASCNAQEHMTQKYRKVLLSGMKPARRFWLWSGLFEGFSLFTILSIFGVTLWIGVQEYNDGTIASGGNVVAVVSTISLTAYYLGLLGPHMTSIVTARVAAAIVYRVIDEKTGRDDDGKVELTALDSIAFEQVVFKYPTREQPILKGLSWKAEKGESIAFVGHSGCGKSTSISLIAKLYPPNSGRILVNGYPIDAVKTKSLRQMIGIVEQEPLLFNGTILENIRVGRDDVSEEAAKSAANTALADAFISQLSEGYNTVLGAHGVQLSGGQKQRIAIARAIAADPKVLLLDEATSALDTQSEKIVQEALDKASAGRTTITIAHRLSTLRNVDRIYVLDGGSVIEIGMHTELIEKGGFYANLAKAQEIEQNFLPEPEVSAGLSKSVHQMSGKNRPPSNKKPAAPSTRRKVATADDEEFPEKKRKRNVQSGFRLIYGNMHGFYDKVALTLVFTAVRALELPMLGLGTTFTVFAMEDRTKSDLYAGLALAICVIAGVATWFSAALTHMLSGDIAEGVTINLRTRAIRSLLYRPLPSFDRKSTASCVATIIQHAPKCTGAMNFNIVGILSLWISALLSISISFFFCWPLALLGVGLCVLISILISVNIVFGNRSRISKEKKDHSAEYAVEVVERVRTIQLLTTENWFIHRFAQQQQSAVKFEERVNLVEALNQALSNSCVFFTELSTYGLASYFLYTGYTNMHRAFIGLSGSQFAGWSIMYSAPYYPDVISAFSSAKQLFDIIDDDDVIQHVVHNGTSPEVKGSVLLANVDFAYPSRPNQLVARNLNLHANVGQSIALVGPSGCGKSTTINLLEAFYQTTHGDVMIDDIEISTINVLHLRRNIALVGQEPVLFRGTIVENITLGTEGITMEDVLKACQTANAANFIEAFPQGYETDVGEGGRALSGGQKQRVAIARALIRRPEIILLDEATSALDTESEKVVQRALNDASVGRTSITVAHRLSSIQHCDRIFVIEKGAVVEYGSHGELLALGGHYARLVQAQSLSN